MERVFVTDASQAPVKATSAPTATLDPRPQRGLAEFTAGAGPTSEAPTPSVPIGLIAGVACVAALLLVVGLVWALNRTQGGDQQTAQADVTSPPPPPLSDAQSQKAAPPPPPVALETAPAAQAEPSPPAIAKAPLASPASTSPVAKQNPQQPGNSADGRSPAPGSLKAASPLAQGQPASVRWGEVWRLPAVTSASPEKLASTEEAQAGGRITIKSAGADIRPGASFNVTPDSDPAAWTLRYASPFEAVAGKDALALLRRDGHDLTLAWVTPPSFPQAQRQIQNCLLEFNDGTLRRVGQLREPLRLQPIALDPAVEKQVIPLQIPDPPRPDGLRLEVAGLNAFSSGAKLRGDLKTVTASAPPVSGSAVNAPRVNAPLMNGPPVGVPLVNGLPVNAPPVNAPLINAPMINAPPMNAPLMNAPLVIDFEELPGTEIRVRFVRAPATGNLEIWVEPVYRDNQGAEFHLTPSELESLEEQAKKSLPDAQRKLGPAETALNRKQDEAKKLKANEPPPTDAKRKSGWLAKTREVDGWVKKLDSDVSALKSKIAEYQAHRDAVPKLRSLINDLSKSQATIHYVVYSEYGDTDLLLVDARK